jgi:hypothetical protein
LTSEEKCDAGRASVGGVACDSAFRGRDRRGASGRVAGICHQRSPMREMCAADVRRVADVSERRGGWLGQMPCEALGQLVQCFG